MFSLFFLLYSGHWIHWEKFNTWNLNWYVYHYSKLINDLWKMLSLSYSQKVMYNICLARHICHTIHDLNVACFPSKPNVPPSVPNHKSNKITSYFWKNNTYTFVKSSRIVIPLPDQKSYNMISWFNFKLDNWLLTNPNVLNSPKLPYPRNNPKYDRISIFHPSISIYN